MLVPRVCPQRGMPNPSTWRWWQEGRHFRTALAAEALLWNCVSGLHPPVTAMTLVIPTWRSAKLNQGKMAEQLLCPAWYQGIVVTAHYSPGSNLGTLVCRISHVLVLETPRKG